MQGTINCDVFRIKQSSNCVITYNIVDNRSRINTANIVQTTLIYGKNNTWNWMDRRSRRKEERLVSTKHQNIFVCAFELGELSFYKSS